MYYPGEMVFLVLFVVPLVVMAGAYLLWKEVTLREALGQAAGQALVAGISAFVVYHTTVGDVEVWNGRVTSKKREQVSCEHSYQCNCRESCTGSGNNRSCSTTCDTCYEHSHDYDWNVFTSNAETVTIDRIDRQGEDMPPRWSRVEIGEPTSVEHSYTNYIKGSPDTLFRRQGLVEKYQGRLPKYPEVYDYYRINRFVPSGVSGLDARPWNEGLARMNAELGAAKQVNMLVVLTHEPADWFHALEESWVGGKKNDAVLVIGVDADHTPVWANVMAWTNEDLFKIKLRDAILDLPRVEADSALPILREHVFVYYERKPMKDFEYLKASITPSTTQWVVTLIIGFAFSTLLTYILHQYRQRSYRRYGHMYGHMYGLQHTFHRRQPKHSWQRW